MVSVVEGARAKLVRTGSTDSGIGGLDRGLLPVLACKRLPFAVIDRMRARTPYRGGNALLWMAHDLNRNDKHNHLVPVNLSTGINRTTYLTVWTGLALVIGHRKAQHLVVERRSADEIAQMGSPTGVYNVPTGMHLSFSTRGCTAQESLQFLRTTPGATFTTDMRPDMNIAFADTVGDPLEPVASVLTRMAREVRQVVEDLAPFA